MIDFAHEPHDSCVRETHVPPFTRASTPASGSFAVTYVSTHQSFPLVDGLKLAENELFDGGGGLVVLLPGGGGGGAVLPEQLTLARSVQ